MQCRICATQCTPAFRAVILERHDVQFYSCPECEFLQTEKPYWLEEAYAVPINVSDTGVLQRNLILSRVTAMLILTHLKKGGLFLDFAGGYGIFVRLMRDMGFDFLWQDRYASNLVAKGFEFSSYQGHERIELVSSMETFEHFEYPMEEISAMAGLSDNIIFSTTLLPDPIPSPEKWWYYGLEHGQHISFYRHQTLEWIARKLDMHLCSNHRNLHIFSKRKMNETVFRAMIPAGFLFGQSLSRLALRSKTESDMRLSINQGKIKVGR